MRTKKMPPLDLSAFVYGLTQPLRGLRFLAVNRGLKRYAILPLILNMILYALAIGVFFYFLWHWEIGIAAWDFWGPIGRWLASAVNWMGWMLKLVVFMLALAAAFFTFTGVGMLIASPLNDILSEKTETVFFGSEKAVDLPLRFTMKASVLSIGDSFRNLLRQLFYTVLALPFLLVPLVGFLPLFLLNAYFAGFGFVDTALARNFLRPPHKKLLTQKRFWEILGFGVAMQVVFSIPGLGIILMPVGVVSGTLLYCGEDWERLLADANMSSPPGFSAPGAGRAAEQGLPATTAGTDEKTEPGEAAGQKT